MTCSNTKPSQSTCLSIEAGNKFLRDFVMLHNAMQAKTEQENRIRKVKADIAQAKAEWDAIGGTVPR